MDKYQSYRAGMSMIASGRPKNWCWASWLVSGTEVWLWSLMTCGEPGLPGLVISVLITDHMTQFTCQWSLVISQTVSQAGPLSLWGSICLIVLFPSSMSPAGRVYSRQFQLFPCQVHSLCCYNQTFLSKSVQLNDAWHLVVVKCRWLISFLFISASLQGTSFIDKQAGS